MTPAINSWGREGSFLFPFSLASVFSSTCFAVVVFVQHGGFISVNFCGEVRTGSSIVCPTTYVFRCFPVRLSIYILR